MRTKMKFTKENFTYIADIVKLDFTKDEEEKVRKELNRMLHFIDSMNELDTDNIEPLTHINSLKNVFREDEEVEYRLSGQVTKNGIENKDDYYVVSKTNMFGG